MKSARALAIDVLARVEATDGYLNVVLDHRLAEEPPADPRDAALVTELCYGATRRRLALDSAIAAHASRKLSALEDRVLAALRVGAYQLFYSRVPKRAAVAETVEALKALGLSRAVGFCNAVLRKLAALEAIPLPPECERVQHLALRESHPQWLVERWFAAFGAEKAEQMLAADNAPPSVMLRANSARGTRDELLTQLKEMGVSVEPAAHSPLGLRLGSAGQLRELFGYREGLWQVQDEAAQLVGLYADIPEGKRVLDACAAPGGKACHLAEHGEVVASDLHANKLVRIESEARRLGLLSRMTLVAHDATQPFDKSLGRFDAVVVDAPCTGLGTLRRHPELRYRRKPEDVPRLARLQSEILENCQGLVPPGGLLLYAVCSPEPEEGSLQIASFLKKHPEFQLEPPKRWEGAPWINSEGALSTLPGPQGWDGFFAARLRRTER
jgi:16S rRNA (cytosine967-C5)-methyltransferase